MRISAKADYAVRALVELAGREDDWPLKAEEIATAQHIPPKFLLAILGDLRRAGVVRSQRGQEGGYALARRPAQVLIADVIRAVDGPLASVQGVRPESVEYAGSAQPLQLVWIAVRASLREVLESVTLGDVVAGELPEPVLARTRAAQAWQPH